MSGNLTINNVQALCRQCNNTKNDKSIDYRSSYHINVIKEIDLKITT
jgi:5-methylcytosine-specific restriction endonuclease McrA